MNKEDLEHFACFLAMNYDIDIDAMYVDCKTLRVYNYSEVVYEYLQYRKGIEYEQSK
jgi:hypothetical protein